MPAALQLDFPFASLAFPGRSVLYLFEIAEKMGMSVDHLHDLITEGEINAIDIASKGAVRRELRIPVEEWRDFIVARMTIKGPRRREFLRALPAKTRRELLAELQALEGLHK